MRKSERKNIIEHWLDGDVRQKCRQCGEISWYSHIEYKKAIQVINRTVQRKYGRRRYCRLIRAPRFYLNRYSVYECQNCGKRINLPGRPKKISADKAKDSGLEMIPNLVFWTSMYD